MTHNSEKRNEKKSNKQADDEKFPPPPPSLLRINDTLHTEMLIRRWQRGLWGTGRLHD